MLTSIDPSGEGTVLHCADVALPSMLLTPPCGGARAPQCTDSLNWIRGGVNPGEHASRVPS